MPMAAPPADAEARPPSATCRPPTHRWQQVGVVQAGQGGQAGVQLHTLLHQGGASGRAQCGLAHAALQRLRLDDTGQVVGRANSDGCYESWMD